VKYCAYIAVQSRKKNTLAHTTRHNLPHMTAEFVGFDNVAMMHELVQQAKSSPGYGGGGVDLMVSATK
jgi:hypothetical protein